MKVGCLNVVLRLLPRRRATFSVASVFVDVTETVAQLGFLVGVWGMCGECGEGRR